MSSRRIWELDALRGICILGMVWVHLLYDLSCVGLHITPKFLSLCQQWGGIAFFLLSGICVTLGKQHIRRGITVFFCGMLCTAATVALHHLGLIGAEALIFFGTLHCLGLCMVLWDIFHRFSDQYLGFFGVCICAVGFVLEQHRMVATPWLIPFGFPYPGFASGDYFPLLPNLGFFLLGALAGRRLYPQKISRFPHINTRSYPIRFLCLCGTHSLAIYLLHQPLLTGVIRLASVFHP